MLFVCHPKILRKHCLQFLLGVKLAPKRNWKQCLCKILGWQTKSIMVCYDIFWSGQYRGGAASLQNRNRYRSHFASHTPPNNRQGGLFTPHRKLGPGLNLTMRPTKTASLLWKFSPLGIFWVFLRKVFKNSATCTLCVIKGIWWFTIFPWRVHRRKSFCFQSRS